MHRCEATVEDVQYGSRMQANQMRTIHSHWLVHLVHDSRFDAMHCCELERRIENIKYQETEKEKQGSPQYGKM